MKKMKNLVLTLSVFAAVLALSYGVEALFKTGEVKLRDAAPAESVAEDARYDEAQYMLKEYYGNIGIYLKTNEDYALVSIVDMDISTLPEADVSSLKEGIYLENKEKMLMLVEDFTS